MRHICATAAGSQKEADLVADKLIPKGLDGYIVDPESDTAGANNDWNMDKCVPFAAAFCKTISDAAPSSFVFGTTSGCAYPAKNMKPNIPWAQFFKASDALYPQCYWRWTNPKTGQRGQKINGGTPQNAINKGVAAWKPASLGKRIVPMAGEVDVVTPDEIKDFGAALSAMGVREGHFYTDNGLIPVTNLAAMKAL
jgi:hypothetical protein